MIENDTISAQWGSKRRFVRALGLLPQKEMLIIYPNVWLRISSSAEAGLEEGWLVLAPTFTQCSFVYLFRTHFDIVGPR